MQELSKELFTMIVDAGLQDSMYRTINMLASFTAILFGIWHGRKLKVGWIAILITIAVERILSGPLMSLILFVENGFAPTSIQNAVVVFPYIPLLALLLARLMRKPWKEIWDVMMPVPLMMFAGARIACTVTGCCRGYPCSWGIYNGISGEYLFPIQLLESLAAIIILVMVVLRERKNNYIPDGRNVPVILISYGIIRFFLEFLHDNQKIVLGLASTQFHCMIMIIVGVVTLNIIRKSERKAIQLHLTA